MKKTLTVLMMVLMVVMLFVSCDNNAKEPETKTYKVGDTGPAGGWIFYDCDADNTTDGGAGDDGLTSAECGWRYLEVASADASSAYTYWRGFNGSGNYSTEEGIGKGKSNTEKLLNAKKSDASLEFPATEACVNYSEGGYKDWFLPSLKELECFGNNISQISGLFITDNYWTSSEDSNGNVYGLTLSDSGGISATFSYSKTSNSCKVRPIRSF